MKLQASHSVGFAALGAALALLSGHVAAASTIDTASTSMGCIPAFIGDGDCDINNNNTPDCGGYDGGDCCRCTCISFDGSPCGTGNEFECRDPTAPCIDDDDANTSGYTSTFKCLTEFFGDGDCDLENNEEDCGYDGGDCCECTCVSSEAYTCGDETQGGYYCLDPSAPCVDDDDNTARPTFYDSRDDDSVSVPDTYSSSDTEGSTRLCSGDSISDGTCDADNNNEECGYDGGDCCECTCVFTSDFTCVEGRYDCIDPSAPCINGYVQASTKTTIGVSANAYDTRPGQNSDMVGCQEDGCLPALSRDGVSDDIESRWSCAQKLLPDGEFCEIEFTFEDPQDIMEVQVAFWKGDERSRTLEAEVNGEVIGAYDSYPGTTFNALGIQRVGVETMTFRTVRLPENDWISLLEVRFLVEP